MTPYKKQQLRQAVNHKTGLSQTNLAGRFNCSQAYAVYISKKLAHGYSNPIKCLRESRHRIMHLLKRLTVQNKMSKTLQSHCREVDCDG